MDTSTTLKEQIQALMDSLADTALSAAESRHQSQAGEATCCMRFTGTMDS